MSNQVKYLYIPTLLLGILVLYSQGVGGGFVFDDFSNIVEVKSLYIESLTWAELNQAWNSGIAGPTGRPIAVLSFALNYYFASSMDASLFKWTNIVIHVINTLLVFLFIDSLLKNYIASNQGDKSRTANLATGMALISAAIWAFHPLHVSSVLYVVQRMNLLAALFSLLALIMYVRIRSAGIASTVALGAALSGLALVVIAGVLSKENALLVLPMMVLVECLIFRFKYSGRHEFLFVMAILAFGLILPLIGLFGLLVFEPEMLLGGYQYRDFDLLSRLLTQGRLFWVYLDWILLPNLSQYGFHHDDIALSSGLLSPPVTLVSVLALVAVVVVTLWKWRSLGVVAFGLAFFMTGHLMESTILPLELVFEHRNYLPSLGLILALVSLVQLILERFNLAQQSRKLIPVFAVLLCVLVSVQTFMRVDKWGKPLYSQALDVANHPNSARSHHAFASSMVSVNAYRENYELIAEHFNKSSELDSRGMGGVFAVLTLNLITDRELTTESVIELERRHETSWYRAETLVFLNKLITRCLEFDCSQSRLDQALNRMIGRAFEYPLSDYLENQYSILRARSLLAFDQDQAGATQLLQKVIERDPNQVAANTLLFNIYLSDKSIVEREQILQQFARSSLAKQKPFLVREYRRIFIEEALVEPAD